MYENKTISAIQSSSNIALVRVKTHYLDAVIAIRLDRKTEDRMT
jgi:hypothetical protein